jgi:hypothetical protein
LSSQVFARGFERGLLDGLRSGGMELKAAACILPEIDNVHDLRGRFGSREILDPDRMDIVGIRLPRNYLRNDGAILVASVVLAEWPVLLKLLFTRETLSTLPFIETSTVPSSAIALLRASRTLPSSASWDCVEGGCAEIGAEANMSVKPTSVLAINSSFDFIASLQ